MLKVIIFLFISETCVTSEALCFHCYAFRNIQTRPRRLERLVSNVAWVSERVGECQQSSICECGLVILLSTKIG